MQSKVVSGKSYSFSYKKYLEQFNPSHLDALSFRGVTQIQLRKIFGQMTAYWSQENERELITTVFRHAKEAHKFQKRKSGEDYISHPMQVGIVLYVLTQVFGRKILFRNILPATGPAIKKLHRLALIVTLIHDVVEDQGWYFAYKQWLKKFPQKIEEKVSDHFRLSRETISLNQVKRILPDSADQSRYFRAMEEQGLTDRFEFRKRIPEIDTDTRLSDLQKKKLKHLLKNFLEIRDKHRQLSLQYIQEEFGADVAKSMRIISRPNTLGLTAEKVDIVEEVYFLQYISVDRINRLFKICDFVVNSYDFDFLNAYSLGESRQKLAQWFQVRQDKARTHYYPLLERFPPDFARWFKKLVELMPVY